MFKRWISGQLAHPSGFIGRYLLPSLWNRHNAALNDAALARLALSGGDLVLEVGFGRGYLLAKMLQTMTTGRIYGVDASAVIVEKCHKRFTQPITSEALDLQCAVVDSLPYSDGYFHKAASVNSLFYWPDFRRGIDEIRCVLRADGFLVLVYTCQPDLDKRGFSPLSVRTFSDTEVVGTLKAEGFRNISMERETDRHCSFSVVTARK